MHAYQRRAISAFDVKPASWQKVLPKEGTLTPTGGMRLAACSSKSLKI